MPTALITGVAGQDGSYLAELLLSKGYAVVGVENPDDPEERARVAHLLGRGLSLVPCALSDSRAVTELVGTVRPDELYNLAAASFLGASVERPVETGELLALGVTRLLEAIRLASPGTRFFQASSSEIFGNPAETPQTEETALRPRNPYGAAKAYAHAMVAAYRSLHGVHASSGILYNHESPRRGHHFVTRKVSRGAAAIRLGLARELPLGSLDARRDWGYAVDFVDGMWRMLQRDRGDDFLLATGETHSVRELCEEAFGHVGLDWREFVRSAEEPFRAPDEGQLVGNPAKARRLLGWEPSITFRELVRLLVDADMRELESSIASDKERNP